MVNPSLKAKIEAAKSALQSDENNEPRNEVRDNTSAPKDSLQTTPPNERTSLGVAKAPNSVETDFTALDARITNLENKLAENQRDLYTLLGKIREITRMQSEVGKNNRPRNTGSRAGVPHDKIASKHQGRKLSLIIAIITGIILGTSLFYSGNIGDQHLEYPRIWAMQFVEFLSGVVR